MRSTTPHVTGEQLYQSEAEADPIILGTPAWYDWLDKHTAFTFVDAGGAFTARKSMLSTGGSSWNAYCRRQGKLYRIHLGHSQALTLKKLHATARAFSGKPASGERTDVTLTQSAPSNFSTHTSPRKALAVDHPMALIQTKHYRPRTRNDLLTRTRLLDRLNAGLDFKVTLVSAPAGFGKTTLLAQWVQNLDRSTVWISLDKRDNEPRIFVQSLTAALQDVFPGMFRGIASLLQARTLPSADHVVTLFINDLADVPDDVVLVLDDYHLIRNPDIHNSLKLLVEHQPHQLHLVLISRNDPPLPLARWRAGGHLNDLRPADLRFTHEETQAFLTEYLEQTVTRETVVALDELSDGWIAVLRLAALSLRTTADATAFMDRLRNQPDYLISGYLLEEILNQLAPDVQELLIKVSILKQFGAELCTTILGEHASQEWIHSTLDWLERFNLFLVPLDEQQGWYRLHHLFQSLLQRRLQAHVSTEELATLHLRASGWYAERGLIEEAIEHALAAGDASGAANLVEAHFLSAFKQQHLVALERWLQQLPEDQIQGSPGLLFARAWILQIHGKISDIPHLLKDAGQLLAANKSSANHWYEQHVRILHALIALGWSFLQFFAGQAQKSLESARSALAWLPPDSAGIASLVMQYLAWSSQACGLEDVAYREVRQAMEELSAFPVFTARLLFAQAPAYLAAGKLHQVEHTARHLLQIAQEADLVVSQYFAHWLLGIVNYEWNRLDAAVYHFSVVIANQHQAHFWVVQDSLCGLALSYQAKGDCPQAQETARTLREVVQEQQNMGQLMVAYAFCGRLTLLQDEVEQAEQWLDMAGEQAVRGPMMFLEDPPVTTAWMLLEKGDAASVAAGQKVLEELLQHVQSMHSTRKTIQVLALQAWAYDLQGQETMALDVLECALALARPGGFIRTFANMPPLARLMHELRKRRKERREVDREADGYLKQILAAMNSSAVSPVSTETLLQQEGLEPLTERELLILHLLEQDFTNKQIARELVVTTGTVKVHTSNVYRKLSVNNRRAAVSLAKALGLLPTDQAASPQLQ